MILKNFTTITPTRRFLFFYKLFISKKLKKQQLFYKITTNYSKKNIQKHFKSTHVTKVKKYPQFVYSYFTLKHFSSVLLNFSLHPKKNKLFAFFRNIYNANLTIPATDLLFAGFKYIQNTLRINQPMFLSDVPYYYTISLISLNFCKKILFCKSSGTYAVKLLFTKKNKLTLIRLPSQKKKFIPTSSLCVLGGIFDLKTNICWKGKYSNKKNYKICVRGVAMNPVDHPNGGRTKAKQPEKSPWGWIAKHNR